MRLWDLQPHGVLLQHNEEEPRSITVTSEDLLSTPGDLGALATLTVSFQVWEISQSGKQPGVRKVVVA